MAYNFREVEAKWQNKWYSEGTFNASQDFTNKKKWYGLIEFPYPSGQGLHVGHPRSYTALDIIARKKRMEGYNVLYPIGFDAFGLPAENYAIKNHVHPKITTENNINHFRDQLKALGFSFDWSREVNTTDPSYYKWTQWIFIQLYKKGLAYKATMPINFCTGCKVGLANEEVVNGVCERCGSPVVQKEKSQWMLKITEYAQRLIDDLEEYIESLNGETLIKFKNKVLIILSTPPPLRGTCSSLRSFRTSPNDKLPIASKLALVWLCASPQSREGLKSLPSLRGDVAECDRVELKKLI